MAFRNLAVVTQDGTSSELISIITAVLDIQYTQVSQQSNHSKSSEGFPTTMSNESNEDEVLLVKKAFNFLFKIIFNSFTIQVVLGSCVASF